MPPKTDEPEDDAPEAEAEAEPAADEEIETDLEEDVDEEVIAVADDEEDEDDEDEEESEAKPAAPVAVARPAARPQPGRPPGAKDEPPPPFDIGERVILIQNTRPRTGTPIGNYPVGTIGRVETVLSQTAIVRFETAPDTKEVVAFTCLQSADKPGAKPGGRPRPES